MVAPAAPIDDMKKRWLLNLALLAFVATLIVLVKVLPDRSGAADAPAPLLDTQPTTIQAIRISRGGEDIRLERAVGGWRLAAPVRARADEIRVDALLRLAVAAPRARFSAPPDTFAQYGLERPQATVWLGQTEIRIGAAHELDDLHYVGYGNEVLLMPGAAVRPALQPLRAFFSTHLLDDGRKPVAFKLPAFRVAQVDGVWTLTPANGNVSNDQINQFVEEWRYARALSVTRHAAVRPRAQVQVQVRYANLPADAAPKTLDIAILARKPELILYRADEGLAYHFPAETGDRLLTLKPQ
jgi:hypothetical protein